MIFKKIFIVGVLVLTCSCASKRVPVNYVLNLQHKIFKVAILPFKNYTKNTTISRVIYRELLNKLVQSKYFTVIEEGEIRNFYIKNKIYPGEYPSYSAFVSLKRKTGVNVVVSGEVLKADSRRGSLNIALLLWVRDITTGKLLWTTYYNKSAEEYGKILGFGKIYSLAELAERMIDDILIVWEKKLKGE